MQIRQVGVIGCGLMGSGIAQVIATAGYPTIVVEASQELSERGIRGLEQRLDRLVEKGSLATQERDAIRSRLKPTTDLTHLNACDLVIEAVVENLEEKRKLWRSLDPILPRQAILGSNTSSISITEMMLSTGRPERLLGIHFMNPVPVMKLVEVIRTVATDDAVVDTAVAFVEGLGKTAVRTADRPGFIVNRLLIPYLLDAVRALEQGTGTIRDLDRSMELGCGHPMGPFTLLDFVGLDTAYYIANVLFEEFREPRFAPPGLLKRLVLAGWHGRKTGRGFYDYTERGAPRPLEHIVRA
jgi:3-hydroxybutyryl-CoA dehydrogenase